MLYTVWIQGGFFLFCKKFSSPESLSFLVQALKTHIQTCQVLYLPNETHLVDSCLARFYR